LSSLNSKYTQGSRERTVRYILENNKSATSVGEELGIDKNTVCRWVRDYRKKNKQTGNHNNGRFYNLGESFYVAFFHGTTYKSAGNNLNKQLGLCWHVRSAKKDV